MSDKVERAKEREAKLREHLHGPSKEKVQLLLSSGGASRTWRSKQDLAQYLEGLSIEQLVDIKKQLKHGSRAELTTDILSHFTDVTQKKSLLPLGGSHVEEDDISFPPVASGGELGPFTICIPTLASEADREADKAAEMAEAEAEAKKAKKDKEHPEHPLLPGAWSEAQLRKLLRETPLPALRRIKDQLQDEAEADTLIEEITANWKMELFKQCELEREEEEQKRLGELATCGTSVLATCFCVDRKEGWTNDEYSFVPGDDAHTYFNFFRSRWRYSNLRKYFGGFSASLELVSEEVDTTVNALIIMDALILTIPFGLVGTLTTSFWDGLYVSFAKCSNFPYGWTAHHWAQGWWQKTTTWIQVLIYCVTAAISLACFYYTNRPSNTKKFLVWWVTGKFAFYAIQVLSVISVILLLTVLSCVQVIVMTPSERLCDTVRLVTELQPDTQAFNLFACSGVFAIVVAVGFCLTI